MTSHAIFPSLTRDEVFRLETPRLWLRWPTLADAATLKHWVGKPEVATMTSTFSVDMSCEAIQQKIREMRVANCEGRALGFVMVPQGDDDTPIGMIGVAGQPDGPPELGYHLHPALWGQGAHDRSCRTGGWRDIRLGADGDAPCRGQTRQLGVTSGA